VKIGSTAEVRLAGVGDLHQIAEFLLSLGGPSFADRFPAGTPQDFYRWKYFGNPLGDAIVAIATAGDSVVSVVAASPKRLWLSGTVVAAYELGDFLTADSHRGQGLFSRLIELTCHEAGTRGARLVYVRPNDVAFPILAGKLSFIEARRMDARRYVVPSYALSIKTRIAPAFFRATGMDGFLRDYCTPRFRADCLSVVATERFGEDTDELWSKAAEGYAFAVVRDSRYLNWRFADCPTPYKMWRAVRSGNTVGFLVISNDRENTLGKIIDLFTEKNDTEAARALLATGMGNMLESGIREVSTWTLQGDAESAAHTLLRRALPFRRKRHLHLAFRALAGKEVSLPLTSKNWHFTVGDSDGA
jgi:GNAT superfamily N-acetyltransferase